MCASRARAKPKVSKLEYSSSKFTLGFRSDSFDLGKLAMVLQVPTIVPKLTSFPHIIFFVELRVARLDGRPTLANHECLKQHTRRNVRAKLFESDREVAPCHPRNIPSLKTATDFHQEVVPCFKIFGRQFNTILHLGRTVPVIKNQVRNSVGANASPGRVATVTKILPRRPPLPQRRRRLPCHRLRGIRLIHHAFTRSLPRSSCESLWRYGSARRTRPPRRGRRRGWRERRSRHLVRGLPLCSLVRSISCRPRQQLSSLVCPLGGHR
mmetsp:Transcript_26268/g.65696  ORF Transcript_26268/g.65696 Transcript_26268/m.65696 type:complete len:267 (+) Transcript_26268:572-1372(+)